MRDKLYAVLMAFAIAIYALGAYVAVNYVKFVERTAAINQGAWLELTGESRVTRKDLEALRFGYAVAMERMDRLELACPGTAKYKSLRPRIVPMPKDSVEVK